MDFFGAAGKLLKGAADVAKGAVGKLMDDWQNSAWLGYKGIKEELGPGWQGQRILGAGGFGVTAHWKYVGGPRTKRKGEFANLDDVVVKQTFPGKHGSVYEAGIMKRFKNCEHIAQVVGGPFYDQVMGEERMYLEFCSGGDMMHARKKLRGDLVLGACDVLWNEAVLWSIFACLAKAVMAMHSGSEDPRAERWKLPELCHFDIKLQNILVGDKKYEMAAEHNAYPIVKLADFGISSFIPTDKIGEDGNRVRRPRRPLIQEIDPELEKKRVERQFIKDNGKKGTRFALAPEQSEQELLEDRREYKWKKYQPERKQMGTCTNIWHMGLAMLWLLTDREFSIPRFGKGLNGLHLPIEEQLFVRWTPRLSAGGITFGRDMISGPTTAHYYSRALRALIFECLLGEPDQRIGPQELLDRCSKGLETTLRGTFSDIHVPREYLDVRVDKPFEEGPKELITERQYQMRQAREAGRQRIVPDDDEELPHKKSAGLGLGPGHPFLQIPAQPWDKADLAKVLLIYDHLKLNPHDGPNVTDAPPRTTPRTINPRDRPEERKIISAGQYLREIEKFRNPPTEAPNDMDDDPELIQMDDVPDAEYFDEPRAAGAGFTMGSRVAGAMKTILGGHAQKVKVKLAKNDNLAVLKKRLFGDQYKVQKGGAGAAAKLRNKMKGMNLDDWDPDILEGNKAFSDENDENVNLRPQGTISANVGDDGDEDDF